jgi:membrane-associated phospholipid phosphatase
MSGRLSLSPRISHYQLTDLAIRRGCWQRGPMNRHPLTTAACLIAAMLVLGIAANAGWTSGIDHSLATAFGMREGQTSVGVIRFWRAISWSGGGAQRYIIVALFAAMLALLHHWRAGLVFSLAALLSNLASDALKIIFERARPDLVPHLDHASSFAFPSGHATSAAVVYLLFAFTVPTKRRGLWLSIGIVLTILTGISRIMLGVHWSSDVLGGWLLGAGFAFAGLAAARVAERPVSV